MTLRELYSGGRCCLSFEIFPPKTPEGSEALRRTLRELSGYDPAFISCTYGAGGSTSKKTLEWCSEIQGHFSEVAVAHLTCLDATRDELATWLDDAVEHGVQNIMALRGDRPKDGGRSRERRDGFKYAIQLVELIRELHPHMGMGVAGYPESHVESPDPQTDLRLLVDKVAAGADGIFTQMFFDNTKFFRFRDQLTRLGVTVPVVPGIMPITEYDQILRISSLCGATIPIELASRLEAVKHDRVAQFEIGVEFAIEQCHALLEGDVAGMHFYVLNRSTASRRILAELPQARV